MDFVSTIKIKVRLCNFDHFSSIHFQQDAEPAILGLALLLVSGWSWNMAVHAQMQ